MQLYSTYFSVVITFFQPTCLLSHLILILIFFPYLFFFMQAWLRPLSSFVHRKFRRQSYEDFQCGISWKLFALLFFSVYQKLNPKQTSEHHEDHDMLVLFFCPMNTMKSVKFHVLYLFSLLGNDLTYCMHGWNWNLFIFLKC